MSGQPTLTMTSQTPMISESLSTAKFIDFFSSYLNGPAPDAPDGGIALMTDVMEKAVELKAAIDALNQSFAEATDDGLIVIASPEYRVFIVEESQREVSFEEALEAGMSMQDIARMVVQGL